MHQLNYTSCVSYLPKITNQYAIDYWLNYWLFLIILVGSVNELIHHGLLALRDCLPNDSELTTKVGIVQEVECAKCSA